jgi:hypothetical protein
VIDARGERFISQQRGIFDKARKAFGISFPGGDGHEHKAAEPYRSLYIYIYM